MPPLFWRGDGIIPGMNMTWRSRADSSPRRPQTNAWRLIILIGSPLTTRMDETAPILQIFFWYY